MAPTEEGGTRGQAVLHQAGSELQRARKFKGIRGFAGKPFHPPLTDIPVAAYILAAVFDLISFGASNTVARDFFISGTHVLVAGLIVSVPTALSGFWDWLKSTPKHTQAWRTANWHMAVMLTVTAVVIVDVLVRIANWDAGYAEPTVLILSLVAGGLVTFGALYGGADGLRLCIQRRGGLRSRLRGVRDRPGSGGRAVNRALLSEGQTAKRTLITSPSRTT